MKEMISLMKTKEKKIGSIEDQGDPSIEAA